MKRLIIILLMLLCSGDAEARRHHHHHYRHFSHHHRYVEGGRPYAWCGWYMRTIHGGGPALNLARNWAGVGSRAGGPAVGVIVVWWHHVGDIVGYDSRRGLWVVRSGNDGHAVRTRPRSVAGAIAFRWPDGRVRLARR
jgi:hypothetical protein